ncbi:hypothetical protein PybrP1_002059 [[Pythium] brassicae (nom. inval.)]|nr:hypothetical protein PybrP1_002059 [[Pythium] brassicae (nom. inval.)]
MPTVHEKRRVFTTFNDREDWMAVAAHNGHTRGRLGKSLTLTERRTYLAGTRAQPEPRSRRTSKKR